jgi:hypothetical protein
MPSTFRLTCAASLLVASAVAVLCPAPAQADSKCTKQIRAQGYFITDVDSDWGRPYDKFDGIKDGKQYDLWVNKNSCKIEQRVIDNDRYGHYND